MGIYDKEGENGVFGYPKGCGSSGVFDTRRHHNVKHKPEYRRIRRYYKSAGRWRKERERRRRCLQLFEEGLSYADIAGRLGVSERTVKRDMAKIRPYYERKVRSYLRKLEEARIAQVEAELEGKSLSERLKVLERTWNDYLKMVKRREYLRHQLTVTIDLDAAAAGEPVLKLTPPPPISIKYPFNIKFEIISNKQKRYAGRLSISSEPKKAASSFG